MAYGDLDLEISNLDENDEQAIVGKINSWSQSDINRKNLRAASWSQAIHFLIGNQWLQYNAHEYRWDIIPYTEANKNIDRPVTNHTLRWVTANAAGFTSTPNFIIEPNSDDPNDKTSAVVAQVIQDWMWDDLEKDQSYYEAALWGLTCGTAFRKSFKKLNGSSLVLPTGEQDILGGVPPQLGQGQETPPGQASTTPGSEALSQVPPGPQQVGPMLPGQPFPEEQIIPLKSVECEIISPFNLTFDGLPKRWRDVNIIMEQSVRKLSWIKKQYTSTEPGYTNKAGDVKEDKVVTNILAMSEGLKNLVEGSVYSNATTTASGYEVKESAVVKEVYVRPSEKFPRGLMIVVAGDVLLYRSPSDTGSPFYYRNGKIWHPYTCWTFMKQPGSMWGISLVQQLVPLQRRINAIDALVSYNRKTMAVGVWLIPSGSGIPDESLVGIPGQNVTYDPDVSGAKPEKVPGQPLPDQVLKEREIIINDGNLIANAADIRSGINPSGVTTVGQLQILTEQANSSRSKQVDSWEKFIEESEALDLLNFQDCYKAPQQDISSEFKKYSKDLTRYDWEKFIGSDMRDNTTVRVEKGSTVQRSKLLREQTIMQLLPLGLLGDINDPYINKTILSEFGLSNLSSSADVDVKKAEKMIEMMLDGKYPPVLEVDNPDIQITVLARFMKDPKFLELPQPVTELFIKRFHEYAMSLAKAQAQSPNALPPQKPIGGEEGGPPKPHDGKGPGPASAEPVTKPEGAPV